ncbi:hypothetical protein EEL41_13215 [Muribaculaceae bacterium Isolate-084 (Janvier)]|nr:hypothetical protein EEL37_14145 [Muribaculaceae bacterium Isolate-077 (Janvier)]ROS96788.1 hypothetical protein EEL41_13215 [Muribaculaceae bacterium Isolate-084 (Janvier)]
MHLRFSCHKFNTFLKIHAPCFRLDPKILLLLAMVDETELAVNHLFLTATAQKFPFLKHRLVEVALHLVGRVAIQVDSKILMALHLVCFRVSDWWIVVKVQRDLTRFKKTLPQGDFSAYIHTSFVFE